MAGAPTDILSKLNVGSGLNTTDIVTSLVDAERLPALENIERNESQTESRISAYAQLKSEIQDFRTVVRSIRNSNASSHVGSSSNTTVATFTTSGSTSTENIEELIKILKRNHTLIQNPVSSHFHKLDRIKQSIAHNEMLSTYAVSVSRQKHRALLKILILVKDHNFHDN